MIIELTKKIEGFDTPLKKEEILERIEIGLKLKGPMLDKGRKVFNVTYKGKEKFITERWVETDYIKFSLGTHLPSDTFNKIIKEMIKLNNAELDSVAKVNR